MAWYVNETTPVGLLLPFFAFLDSVGSRLSEIDRVNHSLNPIHFRGWGGGMTYKFGIVCEWSSSCRTFVVKFILGGSLRNSVGSKLSEIDKVQIPTPSIFGR